MNPGLHNDASPFVEFTKKEHIVGGRYYDIHFHLIPSLAFFKKKGSFGLILCDLWSHKLVVDRNSGFGFGFGRNWTFGELSVSAEIILLVHRK